MQLARQGDERLLELDSRRATVVGKKILPTNLRYDSIDFF